MPKLSANSPERNLHHTQAGYRNQQEFLDEILGKGKGDPLYYYPGEPKTATHKNTPVTHGYPLIDDRPF